MSKIFVLPVLRRLFIALCNICFVLAGLYIVGRDMAVPVEMEEIREMPREAALPFRQLTREEKARKFFEELRIDTSHLKPRVITKSLEPWESYISYYSSKYDVDPDLVGAIVYTESRGNPFIISRAGALGLMQIMPSTASYLGFDNILDPEQNIKAGVKYFAWLESRYGEPHALWAWNAGPSRVQEKFIPGETRRFIVKVLSVKTFLQKAKNRDDLG